MWTIVTNNNKYCIPKKNKWKRIQGWVVENVKMCFKKKQFLVIIPNLFFLYVNAKAFLLTEKPRTHTLRT